MDAAIRLAGPYGGRRFKDDKFQQALHASPERRRLGLWRAVGILKCREGELTNLRQLDHFGWSAGLKLEDISWLLDDARNLDGLLERRLALRALLSLWRETGESQTVLSQIREAVEASEDTRTLVEE